MKNKKKEYEKKFGILAYSDCREEGAADML